MEQGITMKRWTIQIIWSNGDREQIPFQYLIFEDAQSMLRWMSNEKTIRSGDALYDVSMIRKMEVIEFSPLD